MKGVITGSFRIFHSDGGGRYASENRDSRRIDVKRNLDEIIKRARGEENLRMNTLFQILFSLLLSAVPLLGEKSLTPGQIQGRLNIVNGYSAECVMHQFYTRSDWTQIEGEVGRNGIDGLYYKKRSGVIREVLVAESKWNKSGLGKSGKNRLIKQMSQEWVLRTLKKLEKHKPMPEYASIKKLVQYDQYRARLFRMFPRGEDRVQIQLYRIKNKGSSDYDIHIEQKLDPMVIGKPKNSFQKRMLGAYNRCRTEALHKYFPMLSDNSIDSLMIDNYLQKSDLQKYLQIQEEL